MSNETDKAKHTDHTVGRSGRHDTTDQHKESSKSDQRLRQLLDKALEGDETAVHSLWTEFGIDYAKEGGRYD